MSATTVGILAPPGDDDATLFAKAITDAGGDVVRVWLGDVPERLALTVSAEDVTVQGHSLIGLRSLLVRKLYFPFPPTALADVEQRHGRTVRDRFVAARERASLVRTALLELGRRGTRLVNDPRRVLTHTEKLDQVLTLQRAGVPVPVSLGSSAPDDVRGFFATHRAAGVIYKPLSGGGTAAALTEADLSDERLALLRNAPVLFQARVPGPEQRVYVIEDTVVAAAQLDTAGVVDARDNLASAKTVTPDQATTDICVRAAAALGLSFAACDVRRGRDGPVLIEVNPAPAVKLYPPSVIRDVTTALAAFLLEPTS